MFDVEGGLLRSILLGDGIEDLQTTSAGQIWVSYFDEGIFGNLGWKRPVGSCGLRAFDSEGNSTFEFKPVSGLESIVECYALNVTSDSEAWCYYCGAITIVNSRSSESKTTKSLSTGRLRFKAHLKYVYGEIPCCFRWLPI